MKKILLTAAGTNGAFSYASGVAKNFSDLVVITADVYAAELVSTSLFSKKHFQVVPIISEKFLSTIEMIITQESVDFYLPLLDKEIVLANQSEILRKVLVANHEAFAVACAKKSEYHQAFADMGVRLPAQIQANKIVRGQRIVLKKDGGYGGRKTKVLTVNKIENFHQYGTIYEYIHGDEYTIDCFPLESGVITSTRQRVEVKQGVCTKAKITFNAELDAVASQIVQKFKVKYPFCFQVIRQGNQFYLIDVNPRLGAGSAMSATNGLDFFSAHLELLMGRDPMTYLQRIYKECIVTRQYANYLMKCSE